MSRLKRVLAVVLAGCASGLAIAADFELDRGMDGSSARAMLSRFGFGATPKSLADTTTQSPRAYLLRAIQDGSRLPPSVADEIASLPVAEPVDAVWARLGPGGSTRSDAERDDPDAKKALQKEERRHASAAVQARLLTIANADNQGHEALLSFWLNHFSIYALKGVDKLLAWDYLRAIEQAMPADSFEELLRASFFHPAMQVYLDNAQSTAITSAFARRAAERGKQIGINENLARELLELHTLGVDGGYTQKDIQELARIITGAGIYVPRMQERSLEVVGATRKGLFLFDPRRHDFGEKAFLGNRFPAGEGISEVDRALHLLAAHPATARHIALKLARRFLDDQPSPQVVDAMAEGFRKSNGKISATLWPLVQSPAFAASLTRPTKFKEPVDYLLSAARALCADRPVGNRLFLAGAALDMGQAPMMRTTPDGYGSRESDWLSPAAMAKRVRFAVGAVAGRVPLAAAAQDRTMGTRRIAILAEDATGGLMGGTPCNLDGVWLERLVGPISAETQAAATGLSMPERGGLLLASPEFMRR